MKKRPHAVESAVLFQPWFLPSRVAFAIHRLVPPDFYNKMRYVFDDYGCMICGRRSDYHSNGMCRLCSSRVRSKIVKSALRHSKAKSNRRLDLILFRQQRLATELLARFVPAKRGGANKRSHELPKRNNPVYEALCARPK